MHRIYSYCIYMHSLQIHLCVYTYSLAQVRSVYFLCWSAFPLNDHHAPFTPNGTLQEGKKTYQPLPLQCTSLAPQ